MVKMMNLAAVFGKILIDACFQLAKSASYCFQFDYDDVRWLALDIAKGNHVL